MVLVFTGHLGASWFPQLEPLLTAIYTFHMPLFFLLSGLFFKPTVNLLNLIIKRAKTLLIPYYLFGLSLFGVGEWVGGWWCWSGSLVVPEFLRTLVFARPRGDDQFADSTFSPSLDMSR